MFSTVAVVATLLIVASLFARIAGRAGFPYGASVVIVGIFAAAILPSGPVIALRPETLGLFLPALVFDAAWAIERRALARSSLAIAILAVPGVLMTAGIIAAFGALFGSLPVLASFGLGAVLAATDPVAVVAVFARMPIPERLRTIVEGESIANDGVAAMLWQVAVALAASSAYDARVDVAWLGRAIGSACFVTGVGVGIGTLVGWLAGQLFRRGPYFRRPISAALITIAVAYAAYALATALGASGIFATAAAGVVLPKLAGRDGASVRTFWDRFGGLLNGIVFLLIGLNVVFERIFHEPRLIVATLVATVVARALLAYGLVPRRWIGSKALAWRHTIALAGLRGGLSLALALGLPANFPSRPAVIDAVFAVVFTTIVIQGWAIAPLLRRFEFEARTAE